MEITGVITDQFHCDNLHGDISYRLCMRYYLDARSNRIPLRLICLNCSTGTKIAEHFGDEAKTLQSENSQLRDARKKRTAKMKKKEEIMARGTKKCPECETPATTNVAPKCQNCGQVFEKKGPRKKAGGMKVTPPKAAYGKSLTSLIETAGELKPRRRALLSQGIDDIAPQAAPKPDILVSIAISDYPNVSKFMSNLMPDNPGRVLAALVRKTLDALELAL